ncbi:hypothetical protein CsSME_00046329 [Camellia sinensis var. sinensis]
MLWLQNLHTTIIGCSKIKLPYDVTDLTDLCFFLNQISIFQ